MTFNVSHIDQCVTKWENIVVMNIPFASFLENNLQGMQKRRHVWNLYSLNAVMKEDILFWGVGEPRIKNHSRVTEE